MNIWPNVNVTTPDSGATWDFSRIESGRAVAPSLILCGDTYLRLDDFTAVASVHVETDEDGTYTDVSFQPAYPEDVFCRYAVEHYGCSEEEVHDLVRSLDAMCVRPRTGPMPWETGATDGDA